MKQRAAAEAAKTVKVRIEGRVQGVWFRAWTSQEASARGLAGWVRNRPDGSVEALFSGAADMVDDMLAACHDGPPHADVTAVVPEDAAPPDDDGFHQLPAG